MEGWYDAAGYLTLSVVDAVKWEHAYIVNGYAQLCFLEWVFGIQWHVGECLVEVVADNARLDQRLRTVRSWDTQGWDQSPRIQCQERGFFLVRVDFLVSVGDLPILLVSNERSGGAFLHTFPPALSMRAGQMASRSVISRGSRPTVAF